MKQTLSILQNIVLGGLAMCIGLILLSMVLGSCAKKITPVDPHPWLQYDKKPKVAQEDTIVLVMSPISGQVRDIRIADLLKNKIVLDTLLIPGDTVKILDSIPCPPASDTTMIAFQTVRYLPAKIITLPSLPCDTIRITKPVVVKSAAAAVSNMSWGERSAWLLGLLASLVSAWIAWKKKQAKASA